jgi:hypothetical protein
MVTSSTGIANLALDLLSAGTVIDIESGTSATEALLKRWYDLSRRKLLREHPWNFAIKRAVLAASSTPPAFGYESAFPVPSDFLRLLHVTTDLVTDGDAILPTSAYQVEAGAILTTNTYSSSASLNVVYVSDFKTVSLMDPLFVDLLAHEIALNVAYKVTENNSNIQRLGELYKRRAAIAKAIDGQERPPARVERSPALHARRAGSSRTSHRIIF